ncbi:MAG TPA: PDZ domain-containing protein [Terriglobales bacterium]|nr:PDZ domain-containing protein [Terriglobales bacterium]
MILPRRADLRLVLIAWACLQPAVLFGQGSSDSSPGGSQIRYTISLAAYQEHLLHIQLQLPAGAAQRQVQLPLWNALYQVRDFSQYVNWLKAKRPGGEGLATRKIDKNTWQIEGASQGAVVEYEVFADQPGPYGAQISPSHAFLNLAEVLICPVGGRSSEMRLKFSDVPPAWKFATGLPSADSGFVAESYDRLVDSPVEAGTFEESDFDEGGGHYRVVVDADRSDYDMQKIVSDLRRIVASATSWMEDRPYQTYLFLYHFPRGPGGGGMEHAYGTAIEVSAHSLKDDWQGFDDVSAHEFFHLWNVKRIRPATLEPVDYSRENYTRALWFSEGVTSTVEDIILLRAGLLDEGHYLRRLGEQISDLERRPAHLTQSAEESSLDAWLEGDPYYRRPERSISYYNKGELLGTALDLAVRDASGGKESLRELFQWMNREFAQQGRFFPDSSGVRQAAEAVCHCELGEFFRKYVSGVEEIPWGEFFGTVGLRVVHTSATVANLGFTAIQNFDAAPAVTRVQLGSEAEKAGLGVGDVLLEINGKSATSHFEARLADLRPGATIHLRARNRRGERELEWKVGSREEVEFELQDVENLTAQQRARRAAWLKGESQSAGETHP